MDKETDKAPVYLTRFQSKKLNVSPSSRTKSSSKSSLYLIRKWGGVIFLPLSVAIRQPLLREKIFLKNSTIF